MCFASANRYVRVSVPVPVPDPVPGVLSVCLSVPVPLCLCLSVWKCPWCGESGTSVSYLQGSRT